MPKVGKKTFPYTAAGKKAAKKAMMAASKKHEKSEGKKERTMEYGSAKKGKK